MTGWCMPSTAKKGGEHVRTRVKTYADTDTHIILLYTSVHTDGGGVLTVPGRR